MTITRSQITGLVLAGGRGSRMGGVDKGLQLHCGQPLAWHAVQRLAPQVSGIVVNANRNAAAYAAFGWPVLADSHAGQPGPLAGMLAALDHCRTPYLATVPCDAPLLPHDLVQRLAQALAARAAAVAMAVTRCSNGPVQPQPVFCLLAATGPLRDSVAAALRSGRRSAEHWAAEQGCVHVLFDDAAAFANANTPSELAALALAPTASRPPTC